MYAREDVISGDVDEDGFSVVGSLGERGTCFDVEVETITSEQDHPCNNNVPESILVQKWFLNKWVLGIQTMAEEAKETTGSTK